MVLLSLKKFDSDISEITTALDRWVTFLTKAHALSRSQLPTPLGVESIKRALGALESLHLGDDEREVYEARLKWLRDEEMALKTAFNKGLEEGREEGKEEGVASVARTMAQKGLDKDAIIEMTGLTEDRLVKILES